MSERVPFYEPLGSAWMTIGKVWYLSCCDCGLVHRMEFRVHGDDLQLRAMRDTRRTAHARRLKLESPRESVGWLNTVGPLIRSPRFPRGPRRQQKARQARG